MAVTWTPALAIPGVIDEVEARLPLHRPDVPWIPARYADGQTRDIDLTTALRDAHLIDTVDFGQTVVTATFYRILLSIAYDSILDSEMVDEDDESAFRRWRAAELKSNVGFDGAWVDDYFARFDDRFYLIHPTAPFLQDPSLYRYAGADSSLLDPTDEKDLGKLRAALKNACKPLERVHPMSASYDTVGHAHPWGLSKDVHDDGMPDSEQVKALVYALLYQRTSIGAVRRGERGFVGETQPADATDLYSLVGPLRRVVHYLPRTGSLYRDLLLAMQFAGYEQLEKAPEWEFPVDPTTGWLENIGRDTGGVTAYTGGAENPRAGINDSQMAILFVTGEDGTGVEAVRRNRYRALAAKAERALTIAARDARKEREDALKEDPDAVLEVGEDDALADRGAFQLSAWNPYIARGATVSRSPLFIDRAISEATALSFSDILYIPLLEDSKFYDSPLVLSFRGDDRVSELVRDNVFEPRIRVLVNAGSRDQEKHFADFEIVLPASAALKDPKNRDIARAWARAGSAVAYAIGQSVSSAIEKRVSGGPLKARAADLFWAEYTTLFNERVLGDAPRQVSESRTQIEQVAQRALAAVTETVRFQSPLRHAQAARSLSNKIWKTTKENHVED